MITKDHPFFFLSDLYKNEKAIFNFSKYLYVEDSLLDEREYLSISSADFSSDWINYQIDSLQANQELAFHSNVIINNRNFHIPMIDFSLEGDLKADIINRVRYFLPRNVMLNLAIFESGRSYHAYSRRLIRPKEWTDLMGRLLLINPVNQPNIIDTRWVGHRLVGGFSSLRWSNNTKQYLGMPQRITLPV